MKVDINGIKYEIKEVEPTHSMLIVGDRRCAGTTHYHHQEIYLSSELMPDTKCSTLRHELTHAFLAETQIESRDKFNEEMLCEFVAMYGKKICDIADKYFAEGKK